MESVAKAMHMGSVCRMVDFSFDVLVYMQRLGWQAEPRLIRLCLLEVTGLWCMM